MVNMATELPHNLALSFATPLIIGALTGYIDSVGYTDSRSARYYPLLLSCNLPGYSVAHNNRLAKKEGSRVAEFIGGTFVGGLEATLGYAIGHTLGEMTK